MQKIFFLVLIISTACTSRFVGKKNYLAFDSQIDNQLLKVYPIRTWYWGRVDNSFNNYRDSLVNVFDTISTEILAEKYRIGQYKLPFSEQEKITWFVNTSRSEFSKEYFLQRAHTEFIDSLNLPKGTKRVMFLLVLIDVSKDTYPRSSFISPEIVSGYSTYVNLDAFIFDVDTKKIVYFGKGGVHNDKKKLKVKQLEKCFRKQVFKVLLND
jgi:hypothetical protein